MVYQTLLLPGENGSTLCLETSEAAHPAKSCSLNQKCHQRCVSAIKPLERPNCAALLYMPMEAAFTMNTTPNLNQNQAIASSTRFASTASVRGLPAPQPDRLPHKSDQKSARNAPIQNDVLGTSAKNSSTAQPSQNSDPASDARSEAYRLQTAARSLLWDSSRERDKQERVCYCLRQVAPYHDGVTLNRRADGRTSYSGLQRCGSVWACPVCARQITEERRDQLGAIVRRAQTMGYITVMVTYTMRHNKGDKLADLRKVVTQAFGKMKTGRAWQTVTEAYGWCGSVRSLEVTYGDNGWHVHHHEIVFLDPHLFNLSTTLDLKDKLYELWNKQLLKQGFDSSWARGVDVQEGDDDIAEYVEKWGLDSELTKAPTKQAHEHGRTPLQLLRDYADQDDKQAGALWREYALAFKGSQQLVYSKNLLEKLHMTDLELTDEQLLERAAENDQESPIMVEFQPEQWYAIVRANKRAEVLQVASAGDLVALWAYLKSIGVPERVSVFEFNADDYLTAQLEPHTGQKESLDDQLAALGAW